MPVDYEFIVFNEFYDAENQEERDAWRILNENIVIRSKKQGKKQLGHLINDTNQCVKNVEYFWEGFENVYELS